MTPRFKRILESGLWFVIGFVVCVLLHHFHVVTER